MTTILLTLGIFVLILISLFLILVVLMQRSGANAGLGAAFGGGVADSTFGTETANILTKATIWATAAFFILALLLYLGFMATKRPDPERQLIIPELEERVPETESRADEPPEPPVDAASESDESAESGESENAPVDPPTPEAAQ